jgi:endonuclease/exonuclease/phosphatase family metal-dependent hydrolase
MILTLLTYNIHRGIGRDKRQDLGRIMQVIRESGADIVALQEVDHLVEEGSRAPNIKEHAEALGFHVYEQTLRVLLRETGVMGYGNTLLVRQPPLAVNYHDITIPGREARGAIQLELNVNEAPLRILNAHLGLQQWERQRQFRHLNTLLAAGPKDTVLLGDFNEWWPGSGVLRDTDRLFGEQQPSIRTWPSHRPFFALDRIWVKPAHYIRYLGAYITPLTRVASDHLPLMARLEI